MTCNKQTKNGLCVLRTGHKGTCSSRRTDIVLTPRRAE